ncbi:MAG: penicillin-binding protein 2 [Patescibacteria group bacterium]
MAARFPLTYRVVILAAGFVVVYGALLFRLYNLQIENGVVYAAKADVQATGALEVHRGTIYFSDKNGNPLPVATEKLMTQIYAVPTKIEDPLETANRLAEILDEPVASIERLFRKPGDTYELLRRRADAETAKLVAEAGIKGIYVDDVPERFYPFGPLASQLLGYVGPSDKHISEVGHYGLEKFYDKTLAGRIMPGKGNEFASTEAGENLTLTIDPTIQIEAERVLKSVIDEHKAKGGTVIVEDPMTGRVLAMGSFPNFDPNTYSVSEIRNFVNPAVQDLYEPGSVFKVLTMAAGIDAGKITPETTYNDTGSLTLNGRTIRNWDLRAYGLMTMTNVIEKSLNTGAAFAETMTGNATFRQYLERFGFNEKTGIDLPGEVRGDLRQLTPKAPQIAWATASFGQGVAVTPLGLLNAVSAIANGGKLMRPYVNARLEPQELHDVIRPETAAAVTRMMVSAVDKAEIAKVAGYTLAGKTGTAYIPDFKNGGYTDKVINTYVGFGPTGAPRFAILVKLVEPEGAPVAGLTVVPAFRALSEFMLNYYNIPPDRINN